MRWFIAAPFLHQDADKWLTRFVPNAGGDLDFQLVPADYRHNRSRKISGLHEWRDYERHGRQALFGARRLGDTAGILTSFPQLPVTVGMWKRLTRSRLPVVAWTFNLGRLYPGMRRNLSRLALTGVDRFIVHSRAEVTAYSEWLDLPAERFMFVPFETPARAIEFPEEVEKPFLLSMGSAQRDYGLLFSVLAELRLPAVIVAGAHAVRGLTVPPNVTVKSGLTAQQCFELMQRARINVVPVANQTTASGQVTMLDAMMFGRAVIITSCPASVDYVTDGVDAMLVRHGDQADLKAAIERLWSDQGLRESIGVAARRTALETFSEAVVGRIMANVLQEVAVRQ